MDLEAKTILIIDDEENIRIYLGHSLSREGFAVETAKYGKEGIHRLLQKHVDVVLLDLNLPDMNGLDVLKEVKRLDVPSVVIIITAYGDIGSAVEAIKLGASDYLSKPFEVEDIKIVINKALRVAGLENRIRLLEQQVDRHHYGELITRSKKMLDLLQFAEQVANSDATVMIYGETGTGKELVASLIHKKSGRARKPCVTIDCTSLPENLLESELFGHERGSFTGAVGLKKGLFEIANEGTVFLDEIGELPLILQAKILRVLESKSFRRIGGGKYIETDVRIVAATNRDLKKLVEKERFRDDLFYRLNVVPLYLPPLRNRREDIFPLIQYFVELYNKRIGRNIKNVSNQALTLMIEYDWPGNIRELKNIVEHMVITSKGNVISVEHLPNEIRARSESNYMEPKNLIVDDCDPLPDFRKAKKALIEEFEKGYLTALLRKNDWCISKCAREIDMHRSSFQRLLHRYGLKR
ncbi:MAG: sigma-54-dependent Fis family transcriptional regulator [Deltaproteobacteria bacterium]|nr:sigma-54-dependent Fis family transcriptional regulator [Deltaproteobacteria bacterium]